MARAEEDNWSEAVEDLVTSGDTDAAISVLESVISNLENKGLPDSGPPELASALSDLAELYSSKGFSLKADDLQSRASLIKLRHSSSSTSGVATEKQSSMPGKHSTDGHLEKSTKSQDSSACNGASDDDWEAIADRTPDELLSSQSLPGVSKLSLEDTKVQAPKRRGRGTFAYKKHELYSDQLSSKIVVDNDSLEEESECHNLEGGEETRNSKYGTRHILVLAGFPPSTRTMELENLFKDFRDHGVVIRWVNDTVALAVFQTPAIALEARNHIQCSMTVRVLNEDDTLLSSISPKDLEPPRQRPKTSARTAQRLIAHGMGLKLPSTAFGSRDLKEQENDRRSRIVTRQKLKDDAWGGDEQ
ncbi:PREDICTED: coiled-coil domain-containing protein R3HCC1L isoform X2 [Fragaria vesca subsp. vesca]|uniref:coiled-coil domain-containing protein R3HCC1L isoform X2 n=1 Tax=Fragaria vesca subsp. vesca TaxID=101020 RepID=UPI0002C35BAC|nr:PREDICTED: coiled-coil domain-containing protein R3HCC1L isoform X2 [Fragaria vesca subsp. vesca]